MRYDDYELLELALTDSVILAEVMAEADLLSIEQATERFIAALPASSTDRPFHQSSPAYLPKQQAGNALHTGQDSSHMLLWMLFAVAVLIGGVVLGWSAFEPLQNRASVSVLPFHGNTADTTLVVPGTWNVHCPQTAPASSGNPDSVIGPPTVSVSFIGKVLTYYHSPAADQAQVLYDASVRCGIDPVFTLAFFMHESSFGKAGEATQSLSPGNLRCIPNFQCQDGYSWYNSWGDGFTVYCRLIRNLYVDGWGLVTIYQIIPRYAPPSDNNNDSAYIDALKRAVDTWRTGQIAAS